MDHAQTNWNWKFNYICQLWLSSSYMARHWRGVVCSAPRISWVGAPFIRAVVSVQERFMQYMFSSNIIEHVVGSVYWTFNRHCNRTEQITKQSEQANEMAQTEVAPFINVLCINIPFAWLRLMPPTLWYFLRWLVILVTPRPHFWHFTCCKNRNSKN